MTSTQPSPRDVSSSISSLQLRSAALLPVLLVCQVPVLQLLGDPPTTLARRQRSRGNERLHLSRADFCHPSIRVPGASKFQLDHAKNCLLCPKNAQNLCVATNVCFANAQSASGYLDPQTTNFNMGESNLFIASLSIQVPSKKDTPIYACNNGLCGLYIPRRMRCLPTGPFLYG